MAQIARVHLRRTERRTGKETRETVYVLTSINASDASPAELLGIIRRHWETEAVRHIRDTTHDEDRSRSAPRVMATLRNLAISAHRLAGATNIAAATRATNHNPHHLTHIGL